MAIPVVHKALADKDERFQGTRASTTPSDAAFYFRRCFWPLQCRPSQWCWSAPTGHPAALTRPMWSMWCFSTSPGTPQSMSGGLGASPGALVDLVWSLSWCWAARYAPEIARFTSMMHESGLRCQVWSGHAHCKPVRAALSKRR